MESPLTKLATFLEKNWAWAWLVGLPLAVASLVCAAFASDVVFGWLQLLCFICLAIVAVGALITNDPQHYKDTLLPALAALALGVANLQDSGGRFPGAHFAGLWFAAAVCQALVALAVWSDFVEVDDYLVDYIAEKEPLLDRFREAIGFGLVPVAVSLLIIWRSWYGVGIILIAEAVLGGLYILVRAYAPVEKPSPAPVGYTP